VKKPISEGGILAKIFLDTNIFIYAVDEKHADKKRKAMKCIHQCILDASGSLSTQVMQEFASVALLKLKLSEAEVLQGLSFLESLEIVTITPLLIQRGVNLIGQYQLHFWDATILAAAEHANCDVLFSEDFQAGKTYGNLRVENPLV
jgi:predicted nucleic acid-binding protein